MVSMSCRVIYKILDSLSGMLVDAAPTIQEEVVTGQVEVLAAFSASVRKAVSTNKKFGIAGCKARRRSYTGLMPCSF